MKSVSVCLSIDRCGKKIIGGVISLDSAGGLIVPKHVKEQFWELCQSVKWWSKTGASQPSFFVQFVPIFLARNIRPSGVAIIYDITNGAQGWLLSAIGGHQISWLELMNQYHF